MKKIAFVVLIGLTASCGAKSSGHNDAPKPNRTGSGPETLGKWERHDTNTSANLNSVSYIYDIGVIAVGDGGTVIVSPDQGLTWAQRDLGTKENLYKIAWVNNVVYIAGDNTILMSKDNGKNFVAAGNVTGKIRDIVFASSDANPVSFWAVGSDGLVLNATSTSKLENLKPESLAWTKVDVPDAGNLTGVTFSFRNGLIVGEGGFIAETRDDGKTFSRVTSVSTKANLLTVDGSETIGGEGVLIRRNPINGMPSGSYHWAQYESTDLPTIRDLACISDCMAVGSTASGATILKYSTDENGSLDNGVPEASSIYDQLNAITWGPSRYIAVGANGAFLSRAKDND